MLRDEHAEEWRSCWRIFINQKHASSILGTYLSRSVVLFTDL
jgi:hypothetical protein